MNAGRLVCALAALFLSASAFAADVPPARKMAPTPPEKLKLIGAADGMPPRPPGNYERVNYPGSREHYTPATGGRLPLNPFNVRTLVKNFIAAGLPGVAPAVEQFAEPVNPLPVKLRKDPDPNFKDATLPAVPVVRLKPGGVRLRFDLDPLPTSMYVVRVIGALDRKNVLDSPKGLIIECKINDGPQGEVSDYVIRHRGTDRFYDVGEFYFHVNDPRRFHVDLGLHPDSEVDLLVYNVDVHDVLGECAKRGGKTDSIYAPSQKLRTYWKADPETRLVPLRAGKWSAAVEAKRFAARVAVLKTKHPDKADDEIYAIYRRERDDDIWNSMPPLNYNMGGDEHNGTIMAFNKRITFSEVDPDTQAALKEKGLWPLKYKLAGGMTPWRLVDGKGQTVYTLADLEANKPWPGLPFDAPSWGRRFVGKDGKNYYFSPLGVAIGQGFFGAAGRLGNMDGFYPGSFEKSGLGNAYVHGGNLEAARDLALLLCRYAYDLPAVHPNRLFSRLTVREILFAHESFFRFYQTLEPLGNCVAYDYLFPVIKDNQELADAVHRYIPWVETPDDVRTLLDTCLEQFTARQMAYWLYWYDHGNAGRMARDVALQGDPSITTPWVEFIFDRTWEYPLPSAGIQDYMYLSVQRDGTTDIGSYFYTFPAAVDVAKWLEYYVRSGGDPRYDLADPRRYPRVQAGVYFTIESPVAGMHHLGIGDVGGFHQPYGNAVLGKARDAANTGWRWTKDPRFAFIATNFGAREDETDGEWQALLDAAKTARNPYMANRSRVLSDWGGIIEGGAQSDDFRFRHAARVRVGRGRGHAHQDTLDLGLWSLGLGMAGDPGGRGGYGHPGVGASMMHNLVTVDGANWLGHGWVSQLADMDTVQYLEARGAYQQDYARQVALIELDRGRPAKKPPSSAALGPGTRYDNDVTLPRAYFLDVFRTVGGKRHEYNFHAFPEDEFTAEPVRRETLTNAENAFLKSYVFPDQQWGGTVESNDLAVTWRMDRAAGTFLYPGRWEYKTPACEPSQMGAAYDPNSPRKFMRVHILGEQGQRFLSGRAVVAPFQQGRTDGFLYRCAHLLRQADPKTGSLFVAVWEPYAGTPTIKSARLEGNPAAAQSFAVVHIETVDDIHDLCFADATADALRTLADGMKAQGRFAYVSRDAKGLREASLAGGTVLESGDLTIRADAAQYEARVVDVDYFNKTVTLDRPLPARVLDGQFFEVGAPARDGHDAHWTSFEAVSVTPRGEQSVLTWRKGADLFSGEITRVARDPKDAAKVVLTTKLAPNVIAGENAQVVAIPEAGGSKAWRGDVAGNTLTLYGAAFADGDLEVGDRVRLYEFGKGDLWRAPTKVSVKRLDDGSYRVEASVPCKVTVAGKTVRLTAADLAAGATVR